MYKRQALGLYLMSVKCMGKKVDAPIFVCSNLKRNLLGVNLMASLGLTFNPKSRQFDISVSAVSATSAVNLVTSSPLQLEPLSSTVVTLCTDNRLPPNSQGIAVIASPQYPLLSGGPGLVSSGNLGEVAVVIHNCSPCAVSVSRGTTMGFVDPLGGPPKEIEPSALSLIHI